MASAALADVSILAVLLFVQGFVQAFLELTLVAVAVPFLQEVFEGEALMNFFEVVQYLTSSKLTAPVSALTTFLTYDTLPDLAQVLDSISSYLVAAEAAAVAVAFAVAIQQDVLAVFALAVQAF